MAENVVVENRDSRNSILDNVSLHIWKWKPAGTIRAIVYLSHGIGEHLGRYEELATVLQDNDMLVVGHDHVGHGKSGGERVYIEDFSTYVTDCNSHIQELKSENPGVPFFLLGHSMGGLIAVLIAAHIQDQLDGIILSAASVELSPVVAGPVEKVGVKLVAKLFPRIKLKAIDSTFISSIPEEVKRYVSDPLIYHEGYKARMSAELLRNICIGKERTPNITQPVLLIHGSADQMVPVSATQFINDNIASEDKQLEVFDGSFHEVLHDKDQDKARNIIKDWICSHI